MAYHLWNEQQIIDLSPKPLKENLTDRSILDLSLGKNAPKPNKYRDQVGVYTKPEGYNLAGIPAYVVDPHHEVLPYWVYAIGASPAVLLHIDDHKDMNAVVPVMLPGDNFFTYAQREVNIANFIAAAVQYTGLKTVYWLNPRDQVVKVFRDLRTIISRKEPFPDEERIYWNNWNNDFSNGISLDGVTRLPTNNLSLEDSLRELNESKVKLVLDLDLDAFSCVSDVDENISAERSRIDQTIQLLGHVPCPEVITIARSQTPQMYTPFDRVDAIQSAVMTGLADVYGESKAFRFPRITSSLGCTPIEPREFNGKINLYV